MNIIKIKETFSSVLSAMEESGMDISYNPSTARRSAEDLAKSNHYYEAVDKAFLCEDGTIRFLTRCRDGLTILNEFRPFFSCLSNSPFHLVTFLKDAIIIHDDQNIPKSCRKQIAKLGLIVA